MSSYLNTRDIQMLDFYLRQYNETSERINQLYNNLENINNNINQIYFNSNSTRGNYSRNRSRNRNRNSNSNLISNSSITATQNTLSNLRNTYNNINNNINLVNEMANFLDTVPIIPSQRQINLATRDVIYGDINNPLNECCPISLERFNSDDNLTQINSCGHLFSPSHLQHWFRNNVRCPLCRYDIRSGLEENLSPPTNTTETPIPENLNINRNEINEIADQLLLRFINSDLLSNNDRLLFDASNNIFIFETTVRIPPR